MRKCILAQALLGAGLAFFVGCGQSSDKTTAQVKPTAFDSSKVLLTDEPEGALGVTQLREVAKNNDDVVLVGRIGGSAKPWVEGRSAFAVVDAGVDSCDGGSCPCCEDNAHLATALVKLVDEQGHLFKADARELLDVHANQVVVVPGRAIRDDAGNLSVVATRVYVRCCEH